MGMSCSLIIVIALLRLALPLQHYDVVIESVTVFDGNRSSPWKANIGITRDRITSIWRGLKWYQATKVIDGTGLSAAPGFIDTHSHADASALYAQGPINAWNYVAQGVTTIVAGNCGRSAVDLEDLAGAIGKHGINVNMASLIGHNTIKRKVMGAHANDAPSQGELREMRGLVAKAMQAGAVGISTGLAYAPGRFSSNGEILELLKVAATFNVLHASHIRNEGADGFKSLEEVIQVSRSAHLPLFVSHFKITGSTTCSDLPRRMTLIEDSRRAGLTINYDFYPYTASSTNLEPLLPDWYSSASWKDRRRILRGGNDGQRLFKDILSLLSKEGWTDLAFARVALANSKPNWNGQRIPRIAETEFGGRQVDQQFKVMEELMMNNEVQMTYHSLCRNVMEQIATDSHTMVGSDSAIREQSGTYHPHPRGCGTFPRFLKKFVKDEALLSWPEAIWRLTGLSARTFHLKDRGFLKEGYYADIVIFDPETIRDRATYDHPLRTPEGIQYVFVNGEMVFEYDQVTPKMPGRFLRRR